MRPHEFRIWLQGFLDAIGKENLTKEQTRQIKNKLQTVFNKMTPSQVF